MNKITLKSNHAPFINENNEVITPGNISLVYNEKYSVYVDAHTLSCGLNIAEKILLMPKEVFVLKMFIAEMYSQLYSEFKDLRSSYEGYLRIEIFNSYEPVEIPEAIVKREIEELCTVKGI